MRGCLFESELERVARTLTDQFGVQVICQGDEAWTDGKQIVLPSLPEPIDGQLERMVVGYLDHEMAHVAFSDFKVVKEFSEVHPGREAMLNVVEDALIEQRAMQRWPGVRANLDAMFAQIRDRIMALTAQRDAFGRFCTAVYLKLAHYGDMLGMEADVVGCEDLLDEFRHVHDTRDSAELAGRLLERWVANQPPAAPQQPSAGGEDDQDAGEAEARDSRAPTDSSADSADAPGPAADDSAKEETAQAPHAGNDADGDSEPAGGTEDDGEPGKRTAPTPQQESAPKDGDRAGAQCARGVGGTSVITQALAEAIAEHVAQLGGDEEYRVFTKQFDRLAVVPVANEHDVQEMLGEHGDVVRRLRRGLANSRGEALLRAGSAAEVSHALLVLVIRSVPFLDGSGSSEQCVVPSLCRLQASNDVPQRRHVLVDEGAVAKQRLFEPCQQIRVGIHGTPCFPLNVEHRHYVVVGLHMILRRTTPLNSSNLLKQCIAPMPFTLQEANELAQSRHPTSHVVAEAGLLRPLKHCDESIRLSLDVVHACIILRPGWGDNLSYAPAT